MSGRDDIKVQTEQIDQALVVQPHGEIDLSRSPAFRTYLTQAVKKKPERLIIDLAEVPYMDSSGVATLVEAMQTARRTNAKLVLCGLQDKVRSIFEIARLDMVFTIVGTRDEALQS
ncbi:MAG: STAS domain-containing protein [Planctomycetota bacterium]